MIKMCFSFLFIFMLITSQVASKNSCNDECLTKTYCIASDGSSVCSKNNLVTAQFKVIPVFGQYDNLQITLKGYNVAPEDEKTIKVSFDSSGISSDVYTCYKSSLGSTYARYDRYSYNETTESSYYKDGVLYCIWTFGIDDNIWPWFLDLIGGTYGSISIYDDSMQVTVAQDNSQLPIYHAQYLKCCNKVHGNDQFLLTFEQNEKEIRYQLYYMEYVDKQVTVTVNLTRKDGIQLQFECNLYSNKLKSYISNGTVRFSVDQQLIAKVVIYHLICSWATPFVLSNSTVSIDIPTSYFELQVEVNGDTVYTEKYVTLKNSSHLVKLNFVLIAFAVLLQIFVFCP